MLFHGISENWNSIVAVHVPYRGKFRKYEFLGK